MSSTSQLSKLAELRVKTDQELAGIIDSELEFGIHSAFKSTDSPYLLARQAHDEALKLLPLIDDLTERRPLERKLQQLREALDGLSSTPDQLEVQTACSSA